MKKILYTLFLVPSLCFSEEVVSFSGICDDTKILFEKIKEYKESPIALGEMTGLEKARFSLWMNPKTKTWTIVYTKDKQSCVVGVGEKLKVISPNPNM